MSIKRVACPGCRTKVNVAASMATAKCPQCGRVFSTSDPEPDRGSGTERTAGTDHHSTGASGGVGKAMPWLIAVGVAALAVGGLVLLTFLRFQPADAPPGTPGPTPTSAAATPPPDASAGAYREVDLPESTRKKIYSDYKKMMASSLDKSQKLPQGAAGQALGRTLGAVVDREVQHMALIYKVSEDDILQIVAEGDAKNWP